MIQKNLIELYRVRFERFYNGVLTFDIPYCTYDCLFCFSKEGRYNVENNKKSGFLKEVLLDNIYFLDENPNYSGNRVNFDENSEIYKKFFDNEFGISEKNNNLILKDYSGKIVIKTYTKTLVEKIKHILKLKPYPIKSIRFSSGDIVNSKHLDWLNGFIEEFFNIYMNEKLILIIETNGSRFNTEKQKDSDYAKFLELISNEAYKERIHIRISLKNPNDAFYNVLTKRGDSFKLNNAIDFGLYCLKNRLNFHYTIFANYLSIDDMLKFKKNILKKLDNIFPILDDKNLFKSKEDAFNHIFKLIEYERLFYYETIFKEYLIAYSLIKGENNIRKFIEKFNWLDRLTEMERIYSNFDGRHKAYYKRFLNRTIPKFTKNGFKIFNNDLIQYNEIINIYENFIDGKRIDSNLSKLKKNLKVFEGYEGILNFWEIAFGSRFIHYRPYKGTLSLKLKFKNVSIVNRVPLYPGLFYLYDFWAQSKPNYFIYALYAERKYMELKNNNYSIFSINCNPDSHAHTDISRAIPILINNTLVQTDGNNLIDDLKSRMVIDIEELVLKVKDISNYTIRFENFEINAPFFILELEKINYDPQNILSTPFLGSFGAEYHNLWFFKEFLMYLNYFYWTGTNNKIEISSSFKKAFKYLHDFQSIPTDNGNTLDWLELKIFEPKEEILDSLNLKLKSDNSNIEYILGEISSRIKELECIYMESEKPDD